MDASLLLDELVRDEDLKLTVYVDSRSDSPDAWTDSKGKRGIPTIGIGTNLLVPISRAAAYYLYNERLEGVLADLDQHLPWWRELDDVRARVLANMTFNMGIDRLLGFHHMLAALQAGDFARAATEMIASAWAVEVKARAFILEHAMRTGIAQ